MAKDDSRARLKEKSEIYRKTLDIDLWIVYICSAQKSIKPKSPAVLRMYAGKE